MRAVVARTAVVLALAAPPAACTWSEVDASRSAFACESSIDACPPGATCHDATCVADVGYATLVRRDAPRGYYRLGEPLGAAVAASAASAGAVQPPPSAR